MLLWSDIHTWVKYISRLKEIWNDTREHQRTVDALQKCMQVRLQFCVFSSAIELMVVSPGRDFRSGRGDVAYGGRDCST